MPCLQSPHVMNNSVQRVLRRGRGREGERGRSSSASSASRSSGGSSGGREGGRALEFFFVITLVIGHAPPFFRLGLFLCCGGCGDVR